MGQQDTLVQTLRQQLEAQAQEMLASERSNDAQMVRVTQTIHSLEEKVQLMSAQYAQAV